MEEPLRRVRDDFDRIASLAGEEETCDHNSHYFDFLLRQLPESVSDALEVGCGTGEFSRRLASRAGRVSALDFSPRMIELARLRSRDYANLEFFCEDATRWEFPAEGFDCIASIATLHHLPMETMLSKMRDALRPAGTLLVLDLFETEGMLDALRGTLALPVSAGLRLLKTGRLRETRGVREAWAEHGRHDSYLKLSELEKLCAELLPGARLRRHLLWRYSLVWKKPED